MTRIKPLSGAAEPISLAIGSSCPLHLLQLNVIHAPNSGSSATFETRNLNAELLEWLCVRNELDTRDDGRYMVWHIVAYNRQVLMHIIPLLSETGP